MAEVGPAAGDVEVIGRARLESRLLLTEDKDFGDLVFRRGAQAPGVVLLRIDPAMHELKEERLDAAISRFGDGLAGRYTIVEPARFRSRPLRQL
jgi:predicted nuclease of predicted toxin-antitoxin system